MSGLDPGERIMTLLNALGYRRLDRYKMLIARLSGQIHTKN